MGSADAGGYLGLTDGNIFPKQFNDAVAKLSVGQISPSVSTGDGYHFIKLISRSNNLKTLAEEHDTIRQQLLMEKTQQKYADVVEQLKELSFSAENLDEIISILNPEISLVVQHSKPFSRMGKGQEKLSDYPKFIKVAFGDDVYRDHLISKVIELTDTALPNDKKALVMKLRNKEDAYIPLLKTVYHQVVKQIKQSLATRNLQQKAEALVAEIKGQKSIEQLADEMNIEWQVKLNSSRTSRDEIDVKAFSITTKNLPANHIFSLANGDVIVMALNKKQRGSMADYQPQQQENIAARLSQSLASAELEAYQNYLYSESDIETDLPYQR